MSAAHLEETVGAPRFSPNATPVTANMRMKPAPNPAKNVQETFMTLKIEIEERTRRRDIKRAHDPEKRPSEQQPAAHPSFRRNHPGRCAGSSAGAYAASSCWAFGRNITMINITTTSCITAV